MNDDAVRASVLLVVGCEHLRHGLQCAHGSFEISDRDRRGIDGTTTYSVEKPTQSGGGGAQLHARVSRVASGCVVQVFATQRHEDDDTAPQPGHLRERASATTQMAAYATRMASYGSDTRTPGPTAGDAAKKAAESRVTRLFARTSGEIVAALTPYLTPYGAVGFESLSLRYT
jgi:hypothetical protein